MFCVVSKKANRIEFEVIAVTYSERLQEAHLSVTWVNRAYKGIPTLTTDGVIERGLLLTKIEPSDQDIAKAWIYVGVHELVSANLDHRFSVTGLAQQTAITRKWWASCESERKKFLSRLNELMKSPNKARTEHRAADVKIIRNELLITCGFDDQGKDVSRFFPMTIEAAYKYVLLGLYSKEQKRWKRLRKCGHCRSIFIRKVSEGGGRPRDYCTPECQKKSDQKKALIRQRKARQRKSK